MKKVYLLLLMAFLSFAGFGQTVATIYATGASGSYITGNSTSTTRTDGNIVSTSTTQRGYAVFNLSTIPAGAIITGVTLGYTVATYGGSGTPSGWVTYGYAGNLSTVTTAATLFSNMNSGTSLATTTYGTSTGAKTTTLSTAFFTSNIGNVVSICFTGGNARVYTITGETGASATTGTHAPFLQITYITPATVPYTQGFESTWTSFSDTRDIPGTSWVNTPVTGNLSWRRDDDGTIGGWGSTNGSYSPVFSAGAHSARFHSYNAVSGSGTLDLYINLPAGTKQIQYAYINPTGTDNIICQISTDGGGTFATVDAPPAVATTWTTRAVTTTLASANSIIRFKATTDWGNDDIGLDAVSVALLTACSGTPTPGTVSATVTSGCSSYSSVLSLSGVSTATGLTYQWQSSPNNSSWTSVSGATNSTYTPTVTTSVYYRCVVTCSASTLSDNTPGVLLSYISPSYGSLPVTESFEGAWLSVCNVAEVPSAYWRNTPLTGNPSWRREDDGAGANSAGWTLPTSYLYSPAASNGSHSARFHSGYTSPAGTSGILDLYVDLSASGTKQLTYSYINIDGSDGMSVQLSTDGGLTFPTTLSSVTTSTTWATVVVTTNATSATSVVRFNAVSDYGSTDIGLDNVNLILLTPCGGTPTAGVVNASVSSGCSSYSSLLSLSGTSTTTGLTYQWQSSPNNTAWTNVSGATNTTYSATITTSIYYRCVVTCTASTFSDNTPGVLLAYSTPTYASMPLFENFETNWLSICNNADVPGVSWRNTPVTGNPSWRREDDAAGANTAGWNSPTSYLYSPAASAGAHSARFHSGYTSPAGTLGILDLYINFSAAGTKQLTYSYINIDGSDGMTVKLSTDGGATFPTTLSTVTTSGTWATVVVTTNVVSSNSVIRFQAASDYGSTDIGLDNVSVVLLVPCVGTPAPGNTVASVSGGCSGTTSALSLQNFTSGTGVTYQWKTAADISGSAGSYSNISGATNPTYTATISATKWYKCDVICSGNTGTSNETQVALTTGAITSFPYTQNFDGVTSPALPCGWSVLDVNGDGTAWTNAVGSVATGYSAPNLMRYAWNGSNAANDWFFTAPISMTAGNTYRLTFKYGSGGFTEKLEVKWGSSASVAGMTSAAIFSNTSITSTGMASSGSIDIVAATTGTFYYGFHAFSAANQFYLFVDDVQIQECVPPPAVTVTGGGAACGSATLTADNGGVGTIYYQGTTSGGTSTATASTSQSVSTTGTYYFRAQAAGGCWSPQGSAAVTVNALPSVTNFGTAASSPCLGNASTATITSTSLGNGTYTITYNLTGANSATGATATLVLASSTGTFAIPVGSLATAGATTLTVTSVTNANSCSSTPASGVTAAFNVNALPAATIVSGGGTFCGSRTITAANGGDGTIYYQGTTSGGTLTTTATTSVLIASSGTYYFRARSSAGCWGTEGSVTVSINPVPAVTTASGGGSFCGSTSITAAGGAGGTIFYQGTSSGGTSTSLGGTPQTVNATGIYYFSSQSAAGCWGAEGSVAVTVNAIPAATVAAGAGTFAGSTTITASNGGDGTIYYQGTTSGGTSTATPTTSVLVTTSGTYYFRARSAAGCWGPEGSVAVTINPIPAAVVVTGAGTYCGTATLTAANGSDGVIYYQGTTSGGTSTTTATTSVLISTSGTYYFRAKSSADVWGPEGSAIVVINPIPTAAPTNNGYICNGGTVTLTANGANGASTYNWTGASFSSATTIATPTATPTATTVYSLTVTDGSGNPGCSPSTVYTTSVTVNAKPTAAPTNNGYICNGATVTLDAHAANGATAFSWSGDALSSSTVASPTATPTVTNTYSLTVSDGSSQPGCSPADVYTTTVTVNTVPTAAPTNSGPICNGGTVTLTAHPANGATVYSWSGPALSSATDQNPTATPTVTVVYSLTVSDGSGQPGCSPATVYTTQVTVNSTPTAAPTNNGYICAGGTVTLTANPAGGASVYSWSGDATLSSATAQNPTATPTVTTTYSLTVTDGSGNAGCSPVTVYTTTVTVHDAPTAAPTNNGYICNGGTVTLAANGANGAAAYSWSGASLASTTLAGPTATPTVTGVYSLMVTDGSSQPGCSPATVYTTSVTVNAKPVAAPTNNGYICNGGTVTLAANPAGNATTYSWSGSALSSATIAGPTATPTVTTTYSLTVTDGSTQPGCSPADIYTTTVTVNQTPVAAPDNNGYICIGGTVTLDAHATGANTYSWSGTDFTSAATIATPTATPTVTGVYSLTVSDGSTQPGCAPATVYTTTVTVHATPIAAPANSSPICVGGTVTLNANPAGGASAYSWSGAMIASSTAQNATATPTVTGVYSLMVTDGSTQPGCSPSTVYTTSVTVNDAPSLTNATNDGPVCVGTTLHLTANNPQNVTGFSWAGPVAITGGTTASASVPAATTAATGIYTVTVNNATGSGCVATYTTSATVNALPTVASITPSATTICNGTPLTLTAGATTGAGTIISYNWSGPNGYSSTTATGSAVFTPTTTLASGVYSLSITRSGLGCTSAQVTSASVTVNNLPTMATMGAAPATLCAGAVLSLTGNGASGTGSIIRYNWSGPGGYTSTTTGSTQTYTTPDANASGIYSVTVTYTGTGCTSMPVTSPEVTVNPLPSPHTITGGGFYCSGGTGVHIGLDGSEGGINYQLYLGASATGSPVSGTGSAIDFGLKTAAGIYSVVATDNTTFCSATMIGTTNVAVGTVPNAYTVINGGGYCAGGTGANVSLSSSDLSVVYQLYLDGVATGGLVPGTGALLSFGSFTTPGNYTITANPSAACARVMNGSATVFINPLPNVYTVGGGGGYCAGGLGQHIVLDFSSTGVNYQLYRGSTAVGTAVAGSNSGLDFGFLTTDGVYSVSATNATTGCTKDMSGTATIVTNALPTVFAISGGSGYCAGDAGVPVGLVNSTTGVNYQLYRGLTAVGTPVAGNTGSAISFGNITTAGTYSVLATNATTLCTKAMSGTATVSVNPLPTAYTLTGGGSYCAGGAGVHVGLNFSDLGINYQLYNGATAVGSPVGGSSSGLDFGFITGAGIYTVVATDALTGCHRDMSGNSIVVVNPLPTSFTVSGNGTICAGDPGVTVSISNSNTGINYQLYNGAVTVGSAVGGTGSGFSFGAQTVSGTYTVQAINPITGCTNSMGGSAIVSVNALPVAYNVTGGGSYCIGSGSGFNIGLSNSQSGVNYQLYKGTATVGGTFAGTGSSIDFGVQSAAGTYTVRATNSSTGCVNNMTGSQDIIVNSLPTVYTITGGGAYCNGSAGVNIGLTNSTVGVNYQLYNGAATAGSAVAGTGSALDFGPQTAVGTAYSVVATNATTGCTSNMTGTASVSVNSLPAVQTVTGGGAYCSGGAGMPIGLSGSESGINYQLYNGSSATGSAITGSGPAITFGNQTAAGTYSVRATNATTSCSIAMTGTVAITVNALPVAYSVTGGGNYCAGGAGFALGLLSSNTGINYQLYNGSTAVGGSVSGTNAAISFGVQTAAGTYTVKATDATTSCVNAMTGNAIIIINPLPNVVNVTGGGSYCAGGTAPHIGLDFSNSGINYQLYNGATAVGSVVAGSNSSLDFGIQATAGVYTVSAVNATTGCTKNMSGSATVIVNPLPVATYSVTGGGVYCAGAGGVLVGLSNSQTGVNYQLYNGSTATGSVVTGTNAAISFGAQTAAGTYTVMGTFSVTGCVSNMTGSASVTVNPLPTVYNVTGGGTYCAGGAGFNVGLSGSNTGINYQLYNGSSTVGSPVGGTGSSLSFGVFTTAGTYTVRATNTTTGCVNNMSSNAIIVVNPLPAVFAVSSGGNYCIGGSGVNITLSGSAAGINYQLYRGSTATGSPVAGTGSSISFGFQTVAGTYSVGATNASTGCVNNMTGTATIIVNPLPVVYSMTGGGSFCSGGAGVTVGLSSSENGVVYRLYNGSSLYGGLFTGTGAALNFGTLPDAGTYTVMATSSMGCTSNMTGAATIVVNPLPAVFNLTGGGSYCSGNAGVTVGLSGSATGISYKLYNGATLLSTLTGTGSALNFGLQTSAGVYTVLATDLTTSCTRNMSGSSSVLVNSLPPAFNVTGGGVFCAGGAGVNIGLSGSTAAMSYQLYNGVATAASVQTGTGGTIDFGLLTATGTYTVLATNTLTGCTRAMTGSATIATNPVPAVFAVTGGGAYCIGGSGVNIGLNGSATGVNYQLYRGAAVVGTALAGNGGTLSFGLQTAAGNYTVVATTTATGCTSNMSGAATVSINTQPTAYAVNGGGVYCNGGTGVVVGLANSDNGVSYQLYNGSVASGTPVAGTGSGISFGIRTAAGTYTVAATNGSGCTAGMTGNAIISINALPTAYNVTGGGGYCNGGTGAAVGLSGSNTGITYTLYNGPVVVATAPGTGSAISFAPQTTAATYTVLATNTATGCTSNMTGGAIVFVNSLPAVYSVTGGGSYCVGSTAVHIGLSGSTNGVSYQLYNGSTASGSAVTGSGSGIDFGVITAAGTYTVSAVTSSGCQAGMSGNTSVIVNALPTVFTVGGGGSYCAGGAGVDVTLSGSSLGVNYQLYNGSTLSGAAVAGTGNALTMGTLPAGTYTVMASNTTTGCVNGMTGSATINVNAQPAAFTVTGGGSYCSGGTGFHVGLNGSATGINYQLYNGASSVGTAMAGTGNALDFGTQNTAGTYTVLATDAFTGCTKGMTGNAIISVNALPTAYTMTGGGTYCAGGTGFHIGLSGSLNGINYQLYNGASAVGTLTGTGAALDFGIKTAAGTYSVIATNAATGCVNNMSGTAVINVNALPQSYAVMGGGSYCAGGAGVVVYVSPTQTGVNYQLYNGAVAVGSPLPGNGGILGFGLQTTAGSYSVMATNQSTSCIANMTGSATVVVNALPTVYGVTGGGSYCSNGNGVVVGLGGSNANVSYQLFNGTTPSGAAVAGTGGPISFGLRTAAGTYSVVATNLLTSCTSNMSGSAVVVVNAAPIAYNVTGGGNYCAGGNGVGVGLENSNTNIRYQLYNGSVVSGTPVNGTGGALSFGLKTAAGTYTVFATDLTNACTTSMTGSVVVNINAVPAVFAVTGGGSYCQGGAGVNIGLGSSVPGISYQLYNGAAASGVALTGTGGSLNFGFRTAAGTYTVLATDASTGCTKAMSGNATISINQLPEVHTVLGGGSYCAGNTGVNISLDGSNAGISYQLYRGTATVISPVAGTDDVIDFGTFTAAGTYSVLAINTATSCSVPMTGTATISVNALPSPFTMTGGGNYCAGAAGVLVGLNGSAIGVTYQLYRGAAAVGFPVNGTGSNFNFGLQTAGIYSVVAVNATTGCSSNMTGSATVNMRAMPTAYTVTGGGAYCAGGAGFNIGLTGSAIGVNYQLYNGATAVGTARPGVNGVLNFGVQMTPGTYSVVATDATYGCTSNMDGSASIIVNPMPDAQTVTGGGSYCIGNAGVNVGLGGSQNGVSYTLYNGSSAVSGAVAGTGSALDFGVMNTAGVYTVSAATAAGCVKNMTGSATVIMNTLPATHTVIASGSSYCAGSAGINITLNGSDAGVAYQLYNGSTPTGSAVLGTNAPISFGYKTAEGVYSVLATNTTTSCSSNMSGVAPVTVNPLPPAYTVTGGGANCEGSGGVHVGLNGSVTSVNYQLYNGTALVGAAIPGTDEPLDFGLQTASGTYIVIAKDINTFCTRTMSGNAIVVTNPLPAIFAMTGGGSICSGAAGVHVGLGGSATGINYQLYNGTAAVGAAKPGTGFPIDFGVYLTPGIYSVKAVNPATSCTRNMAGSATVIVNALPALYAVTGGGGYCPGGNGVAVGISSSDTGVRYQLYKGSVIAGSAVTGTGSALSFGLQTATGIYTIAATNNTTGCARNMTGSATVSINALPAVKTVTGGGSYCEGGTGVNIGLSGSVNGTTYQLYRGVSLIGAPVAGTGGSISFGLQTIAGIYTVSATSTATTCSSNMAGSAEVSVTPAVTPAVSVDLSTTGTICAGTNVTFSAIPVNGGTTPAYQWKVNGTNVGFATNTYSYAPANGDVVSVSLTSNVACPVPATVTGSVTMTVQANQTPVVTIASDKGNTVCKGTAVTFTPTPSFGGSAPQYAWSKNGVLSSTANTFTLTPDNNDVITCKMTSNYGCLSAFTANSNAVTMEVDQAIAPTVAVVANPGTQVAEGQNVQFTALVNNGGPAPHFQWLVNGNPVAGATSATYDNDRLENNDSVTCVVLSSGPCGGLPSFNTVVMTITSVGVVKVDDAAMDLHIMPNPTKGAFTIKGTIGTADDQEVAVEMTDVLGQVVYSAKARAANGNISEKVVLDNSLANGMYLLNIRTKTGNKVFHVSVGK